MLSDDHSGVHLAHTEESPARQVGRRVVIASLVLIATVLIVYLDRDGYVDNNGGGEISVLDATYYATVTLSTTGYGDITPVSAGARLVNILVITPLRIAFLLILIGTTLEALTARSREEFRVRRWRSRVRQHVVVCGYGTKGRSAIRALQSTGTDAAHIVVVDPDPRAIEEATSAGLTGVLGDAGRTEVLRRTSVEKARAVIVAANRDDAAVLIVLTVRQLNPSVPITASVREEENANLLRQSGADSVITSSDAVGRLLGLASYSPNLGSVMEDLLTHGEGLEVAQRDLLVNEVGKMPQSLPDQVIAVVRDEKVYRYFDPTVTLLARGDQLIVVRPSMELPWAPRPGTHNEVGSDEDE